jgi:hypothetical protein
MRQISKEARQRMTEGVKQWGESKRKAHSELKEKYCAGCDQTKSTDEFSKRQDKGILVPRSRCKECSAQNTRSWSAKRRAEQPDIVKQRKKEWAVRNPESVRRTSRKSYLRKIGVVNVEQVLSWLYSLPMNCQICEVSENDYHQALSIDHDHYSGKVRGWLCGACNSGLGYFRDSPHLLDKAKEYLKRA